MMNNINRNGRILAVTLDHGLTIGPVPGLIDMNKTVDLVQKGGASAIVAHKGIFKTLVFPDDKVIVGSPELALGNDADAVSIHINIGSSHDRYMLEDLGLVADECSELDIPLLAMMYPRGENISNPFDPKIVSHVARIGAELGADVVKTVYTGDSESFRSVVKGCPVPIVIAGGPQADTDKELLEMVKGAIDAGAVGVSMGRNIFQHSNPENITKAISNIIFDNSSVESALEVI